ncbi:MAG: histone deacetylase family protein [Candidatus Hodarchaeota archaeon]
MNEIKFLTHTFAKKHINGRFHPESPERLVVLENWIKQSNLNLELLDRQATKEEILSVHSSNLYEMVKKTDGIDGSFRFDADTSASAYTFKASTGAVATGITAIERATTDVSYFALVRPPGHHAYRSMPGGFCIFNNIAIATTLALKRDWYRKIAIIDFDQHYGNGTAAIMGSNPNVLYFSTHASPNIAFPGLGYIDELGEGSGIGSSVAIPLNYRATEADFFYAFESVITPICLQFQPEMIAISVGFDAYEKDVIGVLGISIKGFEIIGRLLKHLAQTLDAPVAHFLEGGYNIKDLPTLMESYVKPFNTPGKEVLSSSMKDRLMDKTQEHTFNVIERLKGLLSNYWKI